MQREGAVPEETSIEVFILTYAASGREERALAFFAEFLTCRSDVGIGSYSTRLMECEQRGLLSTEVVALSFLGEMSSGDALSC